MPHESSTEHISPEELAEYYTETLPEEREEVIEEHLAECAQCTEEARQWHRFASVWEGWTARAHGAAYQQAYLVRALQQVQGLALQPGVLVRLRQWLAEVSTKTGAAFRVALEAGERASRVVTEGLDMLFPPAPALQPVRVRGAVRTRGGPVRGATPPATTVPLSAASPQARVELQGDDGVIEVHVASVGQGQSPPLVLLVPMRDEGEPRVAALQQEGDGAYRVRFEGVAPGDYLVAFEPGP